MPKVKRPPRFIPGPRRSPNHLTIRQNGGFVRINPQRLGGQLTRHILQNLGVQISPAIDRIIPPDLPLNLSPPRMNNSDVDNYAVNPVDNSTVEIPPVSQVSSNDRIIPPELSENLSPPRVNNSVVDNYVDTPIVDDQNVQNPMESNVSYSEENLHLVQHQFVTSWQERFNSLSRWAPRVRIPQDFSNEDPTPFEEL